MNETEDIPLLLEALTVVSKTSISNGILSLDNDWHLDYSAFVFKVFAHACSLQSLLQNTPEPCTGRSFLDVSSVQVLTRALIETTVVFHYLFIDDCDTDEQQLRYLRWQLSDLLLRVSIFESDILINTRRLSDSIELDQKAVEDIRNAMAGNSAFQKKSPSHQRIYLTDHKDWRIHKVPGGYYPSWPELMQTAGFSNHWSKVLYRLCASYAHSGSLSILQLRTSDGVLDQIKRVANTSRRAVLICLAFTIKAYIKLLPESGNPLRVMPKHQLALDDWYEMGSAEPKQAKRSSSGSPLARG